MKKYMLLDEYEGNANFNLDEEVIDILGLMTNKRIQIIEDNNKKVMRNSIELREETNSILDGECKHPYENISGEYNRSWFQNFRSFLEMKKNMRRRY